MESDFCSEGIHAPEFIEDMGDHTAFGHFTVALGISVRRGGDGGCCGLFPQLGPGVQCNTGDAGDE